MKLIESLNTVLPYQVITDTHQLKKYQFQFDNVDFIISFVYLELNDDITLCAVDFYSVETNNKLNTDLTQKHKNSLRLFSTVCHIIEQTSYSWDVLTFMNDVHRNNLYSVLVKKLAKHFNVIHEPTEHGSYWFISKTPLNLELGEIVRRESQRMRKKH